MDPETFSKASALVRAETSAAFACLIGRGFRLPQPTGLYPRVRAEREDWRQLGIDFWMSLDEQGRYRSDWDRHSPFDLGGSARIMRQEGDELIGYWKPIVIYNGRPYDVVLQTLAVDLVSIADAIENWTKETIMSTGERVLIRQTERRQ